MCQTICCLGNLARPSLSRLCYAILHYITLHYNTLHLPYPKVPGRTFFPNLSTFITFPASLLVLTPSLRSQVLSARGSRPRAQAASGQEGRACERGRRRQGGIPYDTVLYYNMI